MEPACEHSERLVLMMLAASLLLALLFCEFPVQQL
jgi:hypothetical protein